MPNPYLLWSELFALCLCCYLIGRRHQQAISRRRRARSRRGYVRLLPPAYGSGNPTTAPTQMRPGTYTEYNDRPGTQAVFTVGREASAATTRTGSPTGSTSATASNPGDPTTAAERRAYYTDSVANSPWRQALGLFEERHPDTAAQAASQNLSRLDSHVAPYTWPTT